VTDQPIRDVFCLYLWRSAEAPGALYLANSLQSAQEIYTGLVEVGYLVRALQVGTNLLYELEGGELRPTGRTHHTTEAPSFAGIQAS
jgi:hypothetical protein